VKTDARRLAFEVIADVEIEQAFSNLILPKRLKESGLEERDRAFATELVYGSIRMQGLMDHYLSQVSDRPIDSIDIKVRIVSRLGLYQLTQMRIPDHAVINESTELAKHVVGKSGASFIHAILRQAQRTTLEIPTGTSTEDLSVRYSHPIWIVNALRDSLKGGGIEELLASHNQPASPVLIAWPGLSSQEELADSGAVPVSDSSVAATFNGAPHLVPAIRERRAGVQDLGSQRVVEIFYATGQNGERWLDLCAGPGGKAAYLDSLIRDGEFVANEISQERAALVEQVVRRGRVINCDGRSIPSTIGTFDRILIDAPCTGIGALRRRPEVRWRRSVADLKNLIALQAELLDSAVGLLNSGGVIGYATCSPHLAETKFQIRNFLERHSNFSRVPIAHTRADGDGDLQLFTHLDGTDSMFLSLLQKMEQ